MPYADAVIREVLRIAPPSASVFRRTTVDMEVGEGRCAHDPCSTSCAVALLSLSSCVAERAAPAADALTDTVYSGST